MMSLYSFLVLHTKALHSYEVESIEMSKSRIGASSLHDNKEVDMRSQQKVFDELSLQ
jgi:hypothetical protein